jgi:DNA-binding NtrC family response regulator
MSMRRAHARSRQAPLTVACAEFGWDGAAIASLRHASLPWFAESGPSVRLEAVPLGECAGRGTRDRLSLLGQFAAHQAFLKFAGIAEERFRAEEWAAVFRRGEDCRLVRLSARESQQGEDDGELPLIHAAAELLDAPPLPVLKQAWGKAEHVYHEIDRLLRTETRADISWFRRSATGCILAPSPEGLRALLANHSVRSEDVSALLALEAWSEMAGARPFVLLGGGSATPLVPFSACGALLGKIGGPPHGTPAALVERILSWAATVRPIFAVSGLARFDRQSREIVKMLTNEPELLTWIIVADSPEIEPLAERIGGVDGGGARSFLLSPRAGYLPEAYARLGSLPPAERWAWLERWSRSEAFARFLDTGAIAVSTSEQTLKEIEEPRRSYLAALAVIGREVARTNAEKLLAELGSTLPLEEVVVEPAAILTIDRIVFEERARESLVLSLPAETQKSLSRLGATLLEGLGDHLAAAQLFWAADDGERAREHLEAIPWWPDEWQSTLARLEMFPDTIVRESDVLSDVYARAAIRAGRYRRARTFADLLPVPRREYLCALAERRLGNYAVALELLRQVPADAFDPLLLEGELLRLTGDTATAAERFRRCRDLADTREREVEIGFHHALLSFDCGEAPDESWMSLTTESERYFVERCIAYRLLAQRQYSQASAHAAAALECAADVPQRIDAALDVMEAAFLAGSWDQARHRARQALAIVEETEGDRAAGGILFLLAYLCADEGQWQQATRKIERLRRFYSGARDPVRLREIDLLEAHLALGRGDLPVAGQKARAFQEGEFSAEIREAAALILDEIAWMQGLPGETVSRGQSACIELTERHLLQSARRTRHSRQPLRGRFARALLSWEASGWVEPPPVQEARTGAEKLQLLRAIFAARSRGVAGLEQALEELRRTLDVSFATGDAAAKGPEMAELRFLQELALTSYPFPAAPIGGLQWRFATRNRLGRWSESGSLPQLSSDEIESVACTGAADYLRVDEGAVLYIEGLDQWSAGSRRSAGELFRLRSENFNLRRAIAQDADAIRDAPASSSAGVLGQCTAIRDLMALAAKVARRDVPVCILGESGTGKELVARAIHTESARRVGPFTAINCAALPEHLVESELFGHARGAFTGAERDHGGLIESSDRGTLFLDEIGEMPLPAQAKLLRFLQEGEFRRVGESRARHADVRIVAATNRKLEQFVDDGRFREDLYYRIRGIELKVPPLRERGGDVLLLARHFLAAERAKHGSGPDRFAPEVEQVLACYLWPGNVRELQNTVRAAHAIAANSREIELEHLPERLRSTPSAAVARGSYFEELLRFRKTLVERSLQQAKGNQNQAAKLLGMSRQALAYQIRELGILVSRPR